MLFLFVFWSKIFENFLFLNIMENSKLTILSWVTVIVVAELIAFSFLQRSVDPKISSKKQTMYIIIAMLLFGCIVPIAFRETLKTEKSSLQMSNLFWVIFSQLGTILLGYIMFQQNLDKYDWLATILLIASAVVAFFKETH